jgi:5-methylcytosine-specific restriction endonuclease McrA
VSFHVNNSGRRDTFDRRTQCAIESHRKRVKEALGPSAHLPYGLCEFRRLVRQALRDPCPYCQRQMTAATWSTDHQTPVGRGGGFGLDNLLIVCKLCNDVKGALTDEEFRVLLVTMRDWPSQARMDVLLRLREGTLGRYRKGGGGGGTARGRRR